MSQKENRTCLLLLKYRLVYKLRFQLSTAKFPRLQIFTNWRPLYLQSFEREGAKELQKPAGEDAFKIRPSTSQTFPSGRV